MPLCTKWKGAISLKHSANIEPVVSRSFDLPLETLRKDIEGLDETPERELLTFSLPTFDGEWHPLPERFLDGIDFASNFVGSEHSFWGGKFCYVHVAGSKVYATSNTEMVEYDMGEACALNFELPAKQVQVIRSFGVSPSHVAVGEGFGFRWSGGQRLTMPLYTAYLADTLRQFLDGFDWSDLHDVNETWRKRIAGHFAFKTMRDQEGRLYVRPGQIAGGVFDNRPDTKLPIDTFTDREVQFPKAVFLKVVKVATSIKFVYDGDHSRLLFRGENVRGVAAARHKVAS